MSDSLGPNVERYLYELLCMRFGRDCVYLSPKFVKSGGIEKEVCDILILALPYAIAFQVKWMKLSAEELTGDKAEIKKERLLRRMRDAADQFSEICSCISHANNVELPIVLGTNYTGTFTLPMDKIEHLAPVVIICFEDRWYCDPDRRYCDVPPVITDAGKQAQKYGKIHSFLMADFVRIVDQLFSVGDLMLWLSEREKMFGDKPKMFIGYNEMTIFLLYLYNNPVFKRLSDCDGVCLDDNGAFERETEKYKEEFNRRKEFFEAGTLIDKVEGMLARAAMNMYLSQGQNGIAIDYLQSMGRFKRLPSLSRVGLSRKLLRCIELYKSNSDGTCARGTYSIFGEGSISSTLFYLGVCDFTATDGEGLCGYAYLRALSNAMHEGYANRVKEVLVLLVRKDRPDICSKLYFVEPLDFQNVMSKEELESSRYSFSKERFKMTEWEAVKQW